MNLATPIMGKTFPAYASRFELHPNEGKAFSHLSPILENLEQVDFSFKVVDSAVNQGQMASDFDLALENKLLDLGTSTLEFALPAPIPQELDFAFTFNDRKVAVEIEKTNREKILRDFLKCHMYFHAGADFALVVLPRNYAHKIGVWDLFEFGVQRFQECRHYGFGTDDKLDRILLLGYTQFEGTTGERLSTRTRKAMREAAALPS